MIKHIILGLLLTLIGYTDPLQDKDFDGVPDIMDECEDTPFLNEVNAQGCTVNILTLPFETESESLILRLGYGYSTNEDLIDREVQRNTKVELSYYKNNWSYSLLTGVYSHQTHSGTLDTLLRIRKRIHIDPKFVLALGAGLRLPTDDFTGNRTDYLFYSSFHYYPSTSLSFFGGYNYTIIGDKMDIAPLKNTNTFYLGSGYFFTPDFYMNLSYSYEESKFTAEHNIKAISGSVYYKINEKWFTTIYYKHEIDDEDLHNSLIIKLGYHIW